MIGLLAGCASGPKGGGGQGGGFSGRDGPGANPPSGLAQVPNAEPRVEAIRGSGGTSKPYTVLGRGYTPITDDRPFRERGLASWYGRKFHGQSTASGEPYDMYAMTAAHKTLPLPSYVRVRNPANGREAIVRVNDRGPFHDDRVIDLSYTAALQLDLLRGVAPVEIERITNEDIRTGAWRRGGEPPLAAAPAAPAFAATAPVVQAQQVEVPVSSALTARVVATPFEAGPALVPDVRDGSTAVASAASTTPASPPPRLTVTDLPPMAASPAPASAKTAADPWADAALVNPALRSPAQSSSPSTSPSLPSMSVPAAGAADTTTDVAGATAGYWVQLGAFRERDGAEGLRARAANGLPSMASQFRVFSEGGTNRLQAGPFASREAALGALSQVRDTLGIAPMVVERR